MKNTHIRGVIDNKAAGLESHQFSREANRFNEVIVPPNYPALPRQPRVGQNSRNDSNLVFQFAAAPVSSDDTISFKYQKAVEQERFTRASGEELERNRKEQKKANLQKRIDFLRDWKFGIEANRWEMQDLEYEKNQNIIDNKRRNAKIGSSSVSYNPITLEYQKNERGDKLRLQDAEAKFRLAVRTAKLYTQRNTFDPTRCVDIPRLPTLEPPVKEKAAGVYSLTAAKKRDRIVRPENASINQPTIAILIKDHVEKHAEQVKKISGQEPTVKEALLSWRVHY